jgi:hypothetical protein
MENEKFVEWANENIVVVVGHSDKGHEPVEEEGKDGTKVQVCPLYPGLTCEQHQQAIQDMIRGGDDLPKVKQPEGMPYSCLVGPDGQVKEFARGDDRIANKIIEIADEWQKSFEDRLVLKKFEKHKESFATGDAAAAEKDWKAALKAYAEVDKARKKLPPAMVALLDEKLKALGEGLAAAWAEVKDGTGTPAEKVKAANDLKAKIAVTLSTGPLPLKAEIDAWLKENKPAK